MTPASIRTGLIFKIVLAVVLSLALAGPAAGQDGRPETSGPSSYFAPDGALIAPAPDCKVKLETLSSQARGKETSFFVYQPVFKEPAPPASVLFLLHGAWDGYQAWTDHGRDELCKLSREYGLIIITPDGEPFGWYADSKLALENQIETYLIKELIPWVKKEYKVSGRMGIAGLSMGGHGAFNMALHNPGLFQSVSSMSGILDITRHPKSWRLPQVFGAYEENRAEWERHSVHVQSRKHPELLDGLSLLITVSTGDKAAYEENQAYRRLLVELGVDHEYEPSPGGHDWEYWMSALPKHVAFHARALNASVKKGEKNEPEKGKR